MPAASFVLLMRAARRTARGQASARFRLLFGLGCLLEKRETVFQAPQNFGWRQVQSPAQHQKGIEARQMRARFEKGDKGTGAIHPPRQLLLGHAGFYARLLQYLGKGFGKVRDIIHPANLLRPTPLGNIRLA